MEGVLSMSERERERLRVVQLVLEKRVRQGEAAVQLGLTVRQVKRLVRAVRERGAGALVSQRRGRASNRRIDEAVRARVLELIAEHYADFSATLVCEQLAERHALELSRETIRRWMVDAGLRRAKPRRERRVHPPRERRPRRGELVQIDGSPHDWFEGRAPRCTLIAFVDDATGELGYLRFEPVESTGAYLRALRTYIGGHGVPLALYSDRHSIFTKHDVEDAVPTQFERSARSLGIEPILALSPQAKGRVERTFRTLQDRLVKAMRLAGIDSMESANAWLAGFVDDYNRRFGKAPLIAHDAHRPFDLAPELLRQATSEHHLRKVTRNLTLSFQGQIYQIQTPLRRASGLVGSMVTVQIDPADNAITLVHQGKIWPYTVLRVDPWRERRADDKTLNAQVDDAARLAAKAARKPKSNHPWKRPIDLRRAEGIRSGDTGQTT